MEPCKPSPHNNEYKKLLTSGELQNGLLLMKALVEEYYKSQA